MKKKVTWRTCEICKTRKRTTNTDIPFIGEECYKGPGRTLLLETKKSEFELLSGELSKSKPKPPKPSVGAYIILIIIIVIAFLLGAWIF